MNKQLQKLLKLCFICLIVFSGHTVWSQNTITIGSGTTSDYFYGPIYRSSAGSGFDYSRYSYIITASELAAAGIPSGATITAVEWNKVNNGATVGNATYRIYMENTTQAVFPTTAINWSTIIGSATQVYSTTTQTIPATIGWINFPLSTNFTYTGQNLQVSTDWDISAVSGNPTTGAFNWLYHSASGLGVGNAASSLPTTVSTTSYGNNRPNIRITYTTPYSIDAGVSGLVPITGCLGTNETVIFNVKNYGNSAIDFSVNPLTVNASVTGPNATTFTPVTINTGTLAPNAVMPVTISTTYDMSTPGTYTFNASTVLTGDQYAANDAMVPANLTRIAPTPLPISCDFNSFTGANLPTACSGFTEASGPVPTGTSSLWGSSNAAQTTAFGSTTAKVNLYTTSRNEWIILPKFIVPSFAELSFDAAVTDWNGTTADAMGADDKVRVMISTNCGVSYSPLYTLDATSGLTNSLMSQIVSLNAYAGQEVILAFYATDGPIDNSEDYDFHIDNVMVRELVPTDIAAVGLASPATSGCYSATETVTITVRNAGTTGLDFSANPLTINASVTGPNPATFAPVTINTGTLAVGANLDVDISTSYDMTAGGVYTFEATANLVGDLVAGNNIMTPEDLTVVAPVAIPVGCDFEAFTGSNLPTACGGFSEASGVNPVGTTSIWRSSTSLGTTTAAINLYTTGRNEWILIPKVIPVVNPNGSTFLTFDAAVTDWLSASPGAMGSDDMVRVMVSTDCGLTWTPIFTMDATTGLTNNLTEFSIDLTAYAGQAIILGFHATDGTINDPEDYDFHIDNVMVQLIFNDDVAATNIIAPVDGDCGEQAQDVIVEVTNLGLLAQSNIPVAVNITGAVTANLTGTLAGPLSPGATATLNLGTINTVSGGTLNLMAYTQLATDQDLNNDTTQLSLNIVALPAIPVGVADSGCVGDSLNLTVMNPDPTKIYSWYNAATGGTMVGQGAVFNTSVLNTTTTYYVEVAEVTTTNLETTFAGGNGCGNGNMFNIEALAGSVTITGFDLNVNNTSASTPVDVYYIPGGYQGNETNQGAWTLVGNYTVTGAGSGNAVFLNTADFTIPAGQIYGIYVNYDASYTNGTNTYNDNIIEITTGAGFCTAFSGPINSRTFNGRVHYLAPGCASLRTPVTAHISQIAANAGADVTICNRDVVSLGGANTATSGFEPYTYSWSPTTGLDNPMAANPNANPSVTTNYAVMVMDAAGCMSMDTVRITVLPLPNASFTAPALICSNDQPVQLMPAQSGGQFIGTGVTAGGMFDAGLTGSGTHRIYYSITGANGCMNMDSLDLVVNQSPDATISVTNTNLCFNGGVTTLTALNPGGIWSGNGITNATSGAFNPAVAGLGPHTITYTITSAAGCMDMDQVTLTVNAATAVSINPVGPLCSSGSAVQLMANVQNGTWSGTGVSATGMFNPATAGAGVHTVTYTVVNANNCTTAATRSITVNPSPTFTINAVTPICVSSSAIALTASISGGSWTGPGVINQFTGLFNPANAGIGTHTISYTVTNGFGCSTTQTTTVTVNAGPNATINAAGPFCGNGAAVQLSAATLGGTWSGTGVSASGMFNPVTAGTGMHVITYTVTAGGCTASATRTFVVTAPVVLSANIKHESCANNNDASIDLNVTGGNAPYTYAWSNGATSQDLFNVAAGNYTVTATDANNCATIQSFTINTSTNVVAVVDSILPSTTPSNANGAVYITVSGGTPPYQYIWSNGSTSQDLSSARTDTFTVTIIDANGCSVTYSYFVPALFGVGMDALTLNKGFNMYPNPTSGLLNIDLLLGRNADVRLEVYDVLGRKLYMNEQSVNHKYEHQFDATSLSSGTYIIKVTVDNETITKPFVLTK